uniref:Uncharacterized protein n=1 Tax=Anguilla anguilla TaxID=7936 RepID=A0A0E9X454_ANGAN
MLIQCVTLSLESKSTWMYDYFVEAIPDTGLEENRRHLLNIYTCVKTYHCTNCLSCLCC